MLGSEGGRKREREWGLGTRETMRLKELSYKIKVSSFIVHVQSLKRKVDRYIAPRVEAAGSS